MKQNITPRLFFPPVFALACLIFVGCLGFTGCKNQTGTVIKSGDPGLSGSHRAGQEVFKPLVDESVSRLLGEDMRRTAGMAATPGMYPASKRICFVGVENFSAEELNDYREQLYEMIDSAVSSSGQYTCISRRFVEPAMREQRMRMDDLFVPNNQRRLQAVMEQQQQPFDYLLFAKLTSGTTVDNRDSQRDYRLSLEMINIKTGESLKESCDLSKAYNATLKAKIRNR